MGWIERRDEGESTYMEVHIGLYRFDCSGCGFPLVVSDHHFGGNAAVVCTCPVCGRQTGCKNPKCSDT